jgi:hypothetical protein
MPRELWRPNNDLRRGATAVMPSIDIYPRAKDRGGHARAVAMQTRFDPADAPVRLARGAIPLFDQKHDPALGSLGDLDLIAGFPDQIGDIDH